MSKKNKEGSCFRINCKAENHAFFARIMKYEVVNFYYFSAFKENDNVNDLILNSKPIYSNFVHSDVFRDWEFLTIIKLSKDEESFSPNFFRQDFSNIKNCELIIPGQLEPIECNPEDCIGLERETIYESTESVCEKLVSIISGVKLKQHELYRLRIPGIDEPFDFSKKLL